MEQTDSLVLLFVPFLPGKEIATFDIIDVKTGNWPKGRLGRNITRAQIFANDFFGGGRDNVRQIVLLALPESLFAAIDKDPYGYRSHLSKLLGFSGSGRSKTLVLFLNSVHQHSSNILDSFSGPARRPFFVSALGPHLEMSQQTAVITTTPKSFCSSS